MMVPKCERNGRRKKMKNARRIDEGASRRRKDKKPRNLPLNMFVKNDASAR